MAATNTTQTTDQRRADAERLQLLNERLVEAGRQVGNAYLDAYERTVKSLADLQERTARASQIEWFSAATTAQADFAREMAQASASAGPEFPK